MRHLLSLAILIAALLSSLSPGSALAAAAPAEAAATAATQPAAAPAPQRRSSPHDTMFAFLEAMGRARQGHAESWDAAIATFDTSRLDKTDPAHLRVLADRLLFVLDRLGEVKHDELPDAAAVAASGATFFRYFPRAAEHLWVWRDAKAAPDGTIDLVQTAPGRWQFSATTVAGLNALYDSLKALPPRYVPSNSALFDAVTPTFQRTRWWGWASLLVALFVGVTLGKLVQTALRGAGERLTSRGWDSRATVFQNAASPASLALLTAGLGFGLQFLHLEPPLATLSHRVLHFLFLLAFGWFLYNLVDVIDLALRHLTAKTVSKLDDQLVPLVRKALRIFLVIVFSLVVAQNVFGLDITGWLAGLGIAGLAVSLAAQDSVKNLFGSLTVFFDHPFAVGDVIEFDGKTGPVEEIGFRSTKMRTLEGHLFTIPNMKFTDSSVNNIGARQTIRRILDVTITYDTPPAKVDEAVQILKNILSEPEVAAAFDLAKFPPRVFFDNFAATALNLKVLYWYTLKDGRDWWGYMAHAEQINRKLLRAYAEAGIEFAFPTQTLYVAGDPKRQLSVALRDRGNGHGAAAHSLATGAK